MVTGVGGYRFFDYSAKSLDFRPIFIAGPGRSGKSSLGRLMGSLPHYFHTEEDWLMRMLPVIQVKGLIGRDVAMNIFKAHTSEVIYNTLLMRTSSFRPSDHSYIFNTKSKKEVNFYLNRLKSRNDVDKYLKSNSVTVVFNLTEANPFIDFLKGAYPSCAVIVLNRNPADIAKDVFGKKWLSDAQLQRPRNKQLFLRILHDKKAHYLPYWVEKKDSRRFIKMSEAERSYYYAIEQYFLTARAVSKCKDNIKFVYYEDLLEKPAACLKNILPLFKKGLKTQRLVDEMVKRGNMNKGATPYQAPAYKKKINYIDKYIPAFKRRYFSEGIA